MAWKIERWMTDVFPGADKIYSEYKDLGRRELAVVAAGVLDLALAELLSKRLIDNAKECEDFLGLDEDGRAPCGSFGAKIQLALLVGLLLPIDAKILKSIKDIRNAFAHRINVDFDSDKVVKILQRLYGQWDELWDILKPGALQKSTAAMMEQRFRSHPEAGAGLLTVVFCTYQAYFHSRYDEVERIELSCPRVCGLELPDLRDE